MPRFTTSEDWDPGEQVTDTKLDNVVASLVEDPTNVTLNTELVTPVGTEMFNVVESGGGFKKVQLANIPGAATQPNPAYVVLTDAATVIQTCVANKVYQNAKVTLGGNRTLQIDNRANGMFGCIIVNQDGTGGRTLTLPANSVGMGHFGTITLADLDTTPGVATICSWTFDGTYTYWTFAPYDIVASFCRAYTNSQSLTNNTITRIDLGLEANDNDGMHSTVTNNSRITITKAGIYLIQANTTWTSNSTGERILYIYLNGGQLVASRKAASNTSDDIIATVFPSNVGDYYECFAYQSSGGTLAIGQTVLSATRLGFAS